MASERPSQERFEFFDPNASIDLMQYDIQVYGHIQPETRQRVYDEEMTYVAEGISRPLHTTFTLREQNGELTYFSEGEWQPYMQLLYNGLRSTEILAAADPRKQFLHDMAVRDLANGYAMQKLKPGDSMSWYSPYRDDIELQYGAAFVEDCGFQPKRRMGFLYRATRQDNGAVVLESHSVDNSSEYAFGAAMQAAANPETDMETMVWAYDMALGRERGVRFSAGRTMTSEEKEENVWHTMQRHGDLAAVYFDDLEQLAYAFLPREQTEREKKRLTIGFWAALKERLDPPRADSASEARVPMQDIPVAAQEAALRAEISAAYQRASSRGDVLVGCGGSMKAFGDLLEDMELEQAFDTVFGKEKEDSGEEDDMGPLVFECTEGHINRRPRGTLLTSCQTRPCRPGSVGC